MHERLLELAHYSARLSGRPSAPAALTTIEVNLRKLAGTLERHIGRKAGDVGEDAGTPTSAFTAVDRKSTRLNSSHANISYAVFCLKKKKENSLGSGRRDMHSLR